MRRQTTSSRLLHLCSNSGLIRVIGTVCHVVQLSPTSHSRDCPGHTIVPATIPVGTILYHGTTKNEVPTTPEWVATDHEHAYLFCQGTESKGCWELTLAVTRPLRVLYFDGSSAAKTVGTMDAQDIIAFGKAEDAGIFRENKRILALCEWGRKYGLDGFMRMEMDLYVIFLR